MFHNVIWIHMVLHYILYVNAIINCVVLGSKSTSTSCKSPNKKARDKNRKPLNCNDKRLNSGGLVELEERLCPVNSCDSLGHLNGLYERHFTSEACPMYHRLTIKNCQVIQ